MKAAQITKYGGSGVVKINNSAPKPSVSKGKVLVEVRAAGVNPVDWKIREGYMQEMVPLKFPATLGADFSGVVVETGQGVLGFKKGDEVYGYAGALVGGSGSFAEFTLVDGKHTARKPKNLNHIEAAVLPLTGASAWQALADHIGLSRDRRFSSTAAQVVSGQ